MVILIKALQFFLSLSILIILHEFGHFLAARLFKTRVEKFYLFFNPWLTLFKKKIGDTEYGIGWLPLGGYVKIAGMIDESMDREALKKPPQPWELRSKPAWQRLIIMLAGIIVNAILAILIFAMVLFVWGKPYLPPENLTYGVYADSIGTKIGIQDGDKIIAIDGRPFKDFNKLNYEIIIHEATSLDVERNGEIITLPIPEGTINAIITSRNRSIAYPRFPVKVKEVIPGSPAEEAGLQPEDQIIAVNGEDTWFFHRFRKALQDNKDREIDLSVVRVPDTLHLHPVVREDGTIGFQGYSLAYYLKQDTLHYGFFASFPAGLHEAWVNLKDYVKQIGLIFTSKEIKASESVGGFISIGSIFGDTWDWHRFWNMTAWLSIVLAFMNLLPIPALDGGHVLFILVEMVSGRKPSDKFLEYAQVVGMILLIALLIFANANDVIRLFR